MSENQAEVTPQLSEEELVKQHNDTLSNIIEKIKTDDFCVHFYCPAMNSPSGGIGVLLRMASEIEKRGRSVKIWYEPKFDQQASMEASNKAKKRIDIFERLNPKWVDFDTSKLDFIALGDSEMVFTDSTKQLPTPLSVNPEDIMFIPEGFPNIMDKTRQISCKRVVLAQSWIYILSGMQNGQTWRDMGITDVVCVSDAIRDFIDTIMPNMNIKKLRQGINRDLFKPPKASEKFPMIGFTAGRDMVNQLKIHNVIKMFQLVYPHYRWIRFTELSGLSREEFAERLQNCAFVLYTDEIAGFGTLPLEAMACGTHVIGWAAYGSKEYIQENNGFWAMNGDVFQMADLLGIAVNKWLTGEMDQEDTQSTYEEILSKYTVEGEALRTLEIIEEYKNERINELERSKK